ncbi:hypothetical protein SAMN05428988_6135 [Chitinophaga sp. YR573]|nr:hypothetical protein SAMN05428988_6135 [Chitinophaga sp. YR573]
MVPAGWPAPGVPSVVPVIGKENVRNSFLITGASERTGAKLDNDRKRHSINAMGNKFFMVNWFKRGLKNILTNISISSNTTIAKHLLI